MNPTRSKIRLKIGLMIATSFAVGILALAGCDEESPMEPLPTFTDSLSGTWLMTKAYIDGVERQEWAGLELVITHDSDTTGTFLTNVKALDFHSLNAAAAETLWPAASQWRLLSGHRARVLFRDEILQIHVHLREESLHLDFDPTVLFDRECDPQIDEICPIIEYFYWGFEFRKSR